jgi:uncharacterized protein YjiS (DUF1127 family)
MATRSLALSLAGRAPRTFLDRLLRRIATAQALRRQRSRLADLDPHMLADIGLTEDEARHESRRTVWDVPRHWRH